MSSFPIILMGRILFGLGGENIGVVQAKIICKWFSKNEVAFAISLSTAVSRFGSASNSYITPKLYNGDLGFPFLIADLVCVFSLVCGVVLAMMDWASDKAEGVQDNAKKDPADQIRLSDMGKFSKLYWALLVNCMFIYGSVNAFLNVGNDYIGNRFGFDSSSAGNLLTVYYGISMFTTPLFGFITDKFGRRMQLIISANCLLVIGQVTLAVLPDCDTCYTILIPICIMGLFIGIYAATFWGCVPLVVEQRTLGTAFGLTYACQNASWAVLPLIVSQIQNSGYVTVSWFLAGVAGFGTLVALSAEIIDRKKGSNLAKVYTE